MSVDLTRLLQTLGGSLMAGAVLPQREDYQQKTALMLGILLMMAGEEGDRLAARLVEENAAMRELFGRAASRFAEGESDLGSRLLQAGTAGEGSLRISSLRAENDSLRSLLIDLHAAVEEQEGASARALEAEIWQELVRSNQRRTLMLSPL